MAIIQSEGLVLIRIGNWDFSSIDHALFQAGLWRRTAWKFLLPEWHPERKWVETVGRWTYEECKKKAAIALQAAGEWNRLIRIRNSAYFNTHTY